MYDLEVVAEPRVGCEVVDRPERAGLEIGRSKDDPADPRVHERTGTHCAGLERDDEFGVVEAPCPELLAGISHRKDFRVGGRVGRELSLVMSGSDDLTVDDNDRPDRDVAVRCGQFRLRERHAHQPFVIHVVTLVAAHLGWKHDAQGVSDKRDWLCVTGPGRIGHNRLATRAGVFRGSPFAKLFDCPGQGSAPVSLNCEVDRQRQQHKKHTRVNQDP